MFESFTNLPLMMGVPAGDPAAGSASILPTLVTFGAVFLIFYFLIIRPQNKRQKETKKMIEAVKKGDRVVTIGGIHGTVQSVKDGTVVVKVDTNTKVTMSKSAISSVTEQSRPSKKEEPVKAEVEADDDEEDDETDEE